MSDRKAYLGDGVYVDIERGMFKLTAENGVEETDTIYMEPEVYIAFKRYASKAMEEPKGD